MSIQNAKTQVWQVMGESFELESRYKIVDYLGSGAYGVVCAVHDSIENNVVAIKKCKKIFQSRTLAKRTLREVRLLRLFNHENIVKLKTILTPHDSMSFSELYVVFELMETDLAQIIRSPQKLKEQHTQYFTYQLLQALKYLHSENVVHRDIKPRNILVNADCCLKVADFGLARVYNSENDNHATVLTDYVTTRWYRAPEVIVGWARYTSAVDMWAVGCIIAELIGRTPLFPGADTMKQMELISRIMGKPDEQFIKRSRKVAYKQYLLSLTATKSHELMSLIPYGNPLAIDLILNLLEYNPNMRFSAEEALAHAYIAGMTSSLHPDVTPLVIPAMEFAYETVDLSIDILRRELLKEVQYHNQNFMNVVGNGRFEVVTPAGGDMDVSVAASVATTPATSSGATTFSKGSGGGAVLSQQVLDAHNRHRAGRGAVTSGRVDLGNVAVVRGGTLYEPMPPRQVSASDDMAPPRRSSRLEKMEQMPPQQTSRGPIFQEAQRRQEVSQAARQQQYQQYLQPGAVDSRHSMSQPYEPVQQQRVHETAGAGTRSFVSSSGSHHGHSESVGNIELSSIQQQQQQQRLNSISRTNNTSLVRNVPPPPAPDLRRRAAPQSESFFSCARPSEEEYYRNYGDSKVFNKFGSSAAAGAAKQQSTTHNKGVLSREDFEEGEVLERGEQDMKYRHEFEHPQQQYRTSGTRQGGATSNASAPAAAESTSSCVLS